MVGRGCGASTAADGAPRPTLAVRAPDLATPVVRGCWWRPSPAASPRPRDPLVQPFSATSPWNTPLGNEARVHRCRTRRRAGGHRGRRRRPRAADAAAARLGGTTCAVAGTGWLVLVDAATLAATSYRCGRRSGRGPARRSTSPDGACPGHASRPCSRPAGAGRRRRTRRGAPAAARPRAQRARHAAARGHAARAATSARRRAPAPDRDPAGGCWPPCATTAPT